MYWYFASAELKKAHKIGMCKTLSSDVASQKPDCVMVLDWFVVIFFEVTLYFVYKSLTCSIFKRCVNDMDCAHYPNSTHKFWFECRIALKLNLLELKSHCTVCNIPT